MIASLSIQASIGTFWAFLGGAGILLFSLWTYRWTKPPVSFRTKGTLVVFRFLGLLALWGMVAGISFVKVKGPKVRPEIIALVDNTESMLRDVDQQSGKRKTDVARDILARSKAGETADVVIYGFDEAVKLCPKPGDLEFGGQVSDLESSIYSLLKSRQSGGADGVVLISDGAFNRGTIPRNAALELGIPFHVIGVGDSTQKRDVVLESVLATDEIYMGDTLRIEGRVRATGMRGETLYVTARDSRGRVIGQKNVVVNADWQETSLSFEDVAGHTGMQRYSMEISPVDGELSDLNNRRSVSVRVAEGKRSVLLFSPVSGQEVAALARALERNTDTKIAVVIGAGTQPKTIRGTWDERIEDFDAGIIVAGGKWSNASRDFLKRLLDTKIPLSIHLDDQVIEPVVLRELEKRCGKLNDRGDGSLVEVHPDMGHPLFTESGTWFQDVDVFPPLLASRMVPSMGTMIASGKVRGKTLAAVVSVQRNAARTMVWCVRGLWKWQLGLIPEDPTGREFDLLVERLVRWLTIDASEERFAFFSDETQYQVGESVYLNAILKDESLRPVGDAVVTIEIKGGNETEMVEAESVGDGLYRYRFVPWATGAFKLVAEARSKGRTERRETEFIVDEFSLEDTDSRMRQEGLRAIAEATGGRYYVSNEFDWETVVRSVPIHEDARQIASVNRIFSDWRWLLFAVLFFALEWLVRFRRGMV